tara:strand:+ start:514 stop:675 length:162 start_codon:yes stop_codon:yes gene_type:complete
VRTRELHIHNGFVFEHRLMFYVFTALAIAGVIFSGQLLAYGDNKNKVKKEMIR